MPMVSLCDWRSSKGIRRCTKISPTTARSIDSDRIITPSKASKAADIVEAATPVVLVLFNRRGPRYNLVASIGKLHFLLPFFYPLVFEFPRTPLLKLSEKGARDAPGIDLAGTRRPKWAKKPR